MPSEAHVKAGAQAVEDISRGLIDVATECLKAHGPDPNSPEILSAAFVLAVNRITASIDPTFKNRLLQHLSV